MSRLTKDIREHMARKLVNHRYADEAKAIVCKGYDLFDRVYAHCFPKEVTDALAMLHKHFPDSAYCVNYLEVNAGGYAVTVGGRFYSRWVKVEQGDVAARPMFGHRHNITDEALATEVQEYATAKRNFDDVCKTAYHEALSVLNTMTTGKKLAEAWPEAMAVIGDLILEDQRTLPVVQVSAINAKFKLPPEENK